MTKSPDQVTRKTCEEILKSDKSNIEKLELLLCLSIEHDLERKYTSGYIEKAWENLKSSINESNKNDILKKILEFQNYLKLTEEDLANISSITEIATQEQSPTPQIRGSEYRSGALDIFNAFSPNRMLSYQNVDYLMNVAYEEILNQKNRHISYQRKVTENKLGIAVIGSTKQERTSALNSLANFIATNTQNAKCSLAVCFGKADLSGRITGSSHWITINLRKHKDENSGKIVIETYFTNSLGNQSYVEKVVQGLITDLVKFSNSDIEHFDGGEAKDKIKSFIEKKQQNKFTFKEPQYVKSARQTGNNCGYHAVFNAINLYNASKISDAKPTIQDSQSIEDFVTISHEKLKSRFPSQNSTPTGQANYSANIDDIKSEAQRIINSEKENNEKLIALLTLRKGHDQEKSITLHYFREVLSDIIQSILIALSTHELENSSDIQESIFQLSNDETIKNLQETNVTTISTIIKNLNNSAINITEIKDSLKTVIKTSSQEKPKTRRKLPKTPRANPQINSKDTSSHKLKDVFDNLYHIENDEKRKKIEEKLRSIPQNKLSEEDVSNLKFFATSLKRKRAREGGIAGLNEVVNSITERNKSPQPLQKPFYFSR